MEEQRTRRLNPAALRLAWPGGGRSSSLGRPATLVSSSQASDDSRARKRPRTSSMWVDKYAPTTSAQLCVAPKKVKELRAWMEASSSQTERVLVLVGGPGIGKSTTIKVLASELGWNVHEWNDSYSNPYQGGGGSLTMLDQSSSLQSFGAFLQQTGAGFAPLQLSIGSSLQEPLHGKGKSIILIDELPNLRNVEAEEEFREIMSRHIQTSNVPTVLIFSDVQEGKHQPRDLERLIDTQYLYSDSVKIQQCHPVTKARMKKSLADICKKEGIQVPADFWEEVHFQSGGDLRHAIMSLQFRGNENSKLHQKQHYERDAKLTMFHTLGKLLYAKREKVDAATANDKERPPLTFNPDMVMEQSGMGLSGALTFLGFHSPDFFTDVCELSEAFDHYSDAMTLLDRPGEVQRDYRDSIYPEGYVASIAGRAVADANKHPAPSSFRSLTAPKIFEVIRNQRANEVTMGQLCKRLSLVSDVMPIDANLGGSTRFVTDQLPYMRTIVPNDVDYSLNNLYSYIRSNEDRKTTSESEDLLRLEEQKRILELDDIVDDDSSMEDVSAAKPVVSFLSMSQDDVQKPGSRSVISKASRRVTISPPEIINIDE